MKKLLKMAMFTGVISALFFSLDCGPPSSVSVGVGVHVPGGWHGGPYGYPGGTVVVGRPYPGPYYPAIPDSLKEREFVLYNSSDLEEPLEKPKLDNTSGFDLK